jgi:hypothetical protein
MRQRMVFFMPVRSLFTFIFLLMQVSCAQLYTGRSYLSEMENEDSSFYNPNEDFPIVAGDTGRDWMSEGERKRRTPASEDDLAEDRMKRALRSELSSLESMQAEEDQEFYETHKEKLGSMSQRIYFLKLLPNERQEYLSSRGITKSSRTQTAFEKMSSNRTNDVVLGMQKNDVLASLGKPLRVEVAGNPRNENERWLYKLNGASKFIYFESGEVLGWE